jgi:hypothetical protein
MSTATSGLSYQWQLDGNNLPGDTTNTVTITGNGLYTLVVTDAYGCSSTSQPLRVEGVGIKEKEISAADISLFPNPASQICTISIQGNAHSSYTAQIFNIEGAALSPAWSFSGRSFSFPVLPYAKGIYLVKVSSANGFSSLCKLLID